MKNQIFIMALLCLLLTNSHAACNWNHFPQTQTIYDTFFDACSGWDVVDDEDPEINFSRTVTLQNNLFLRIPTFPSSAQFDDEVHDLKISVWFDEEDAFQVQPGEKVVQYLSIGEHNINLSIGYYQGNNRKHLYISRHTILVKSENKYERPDSIFDVSLQNFDIPCSNAYAANGDRLSKYASSSGGEARVYVKYGEGNTKLTRPFIFVEGVDFKEVYYSDPAIGEVVRYGDNGWENIMQGLSEGVTSDGTPELFRNYPAALESFRTVSQDGSDDNYDIVLIDFKDGADYIQKNGELVIKVIEAVNEMKGCDHENVLLGLSMGGQVARYALATMENRGLPHDTRTYVSFDSPHVMANIPLGVQSFLWQNANIIEPGSELAASTIQARASWYSLNRPAALQMLEHTFNKEYTKGNIGIAVKQYDLIPNFNLSEMETSLESENISTQQFFDISLDYACLRESYVSEMTALGYPKTTTNLAFANGGYDNPGQLMQDEVTPISDEDAILKAFVDADAIDKWYVPYNNQLIPVAQSLIYVNLYSGNGKFNPILNRKVIYGSSIPFFSALKLSVTKVYSINELPHLDGASGCERNDISNTLVPSLIGAGMKCNTFALATCFMPTSSVIGYITDDFDNNVKQMYDSDNSVSPFDYVYFPTENEPHVELNEGNMTDLILNLPLGLPLNTSPSINSLPTTTNGNNYNYGLYKHAIPSLQISQEGILSINLNDYTGYTNSMLFEDLANRNYFICSTVNSICTENSMIVVEKGGTFNLGDKDFDTKSGELNILKNTSVEIKKGGKLGIYNASRLIVHQGGTLILGGEADVESLGSSSELVLEGHLVTTGDVTIQVNGKIIIEPTATFDLGGKLTIIGDKMDDVIIDMRGSVHPEINQNLHIESGTILSRSNSSLIISNADHVELINVRVIPESPENSFTAIELNEVNNITLDNVNVNSFCQYTGILIDGAGTVNVLNSSLSNSRTAMRVVNFNQLDVRNSRIFNDGFSCPSSPGIDDDIYEYSNGLWVENGENLSIQQTEIDGYGSGLPSSTAYGVRIDEVSDVKVEDSEIHNNGYGIYVPKNDGIGNKTNLHIARSTITDNNQGVFMHGRKAQTSKELNYGLLTLECATFSNNYHTNIKGEDLLIQADIYFTEYDAGANAFEPSFVMSAEGNHFGMNFDVDYYQYSFVGSQGGEQVYLRGNFWLYEDVQSSFYSHITQSELEIIADPMLGGNQLPSQCISIVDPTFGDDLYCENCITSDEEDCAFILNEDDSKQTVNEIYTSGINAYRHNLSETEQTFASLAAMNQQETSGLLSKCQFQYQVSRVFAKGEIDQHDQGDISPRSSISEESTFMVHPNPSSESIILEGLPTTDIMIFSGAGQKLMHFEYQEGSTIDISSLPSGLYTIVSANTKSTQRFIVMK